MVGQLPYGAIDATDEGLRLQLEQALELPAFDPSIPIGILGCGWVAGMQLEAYAAAGLNVVALCDHSILRATEYRDRFYPGAEVYTSEAELFERPNLRVVDIATHVDGRAELIRSALRAGKHVLSQKPFVDDLNVGRQLSAEADQRGLCLAVNQNGRWAPHFGALLACVNAGLIGSVTSADFFVAWPHDLVVADKPAFATMEDLVLFDFGAHWFDIVGQFIPPGPANVRATSGKRPGQAIAAPTQGNAVITSEDFVATLGFRAAERFAETGEYRVSGTRGVMTHSGTSLGGTTVSLTTEAGNASISIGEDWFSHGMTGTMRELLSAITEGRAPSHSAASALRGLELCFAAVESASSGLVVSSAQATTRNRKTVDQQ